MREVYLRQVTDKPVAADQIGLVITHFPCVIGRHSECDQVIDLPFISRRHCSLFWRAGKLWVEDLGSHNGTYRNGEKLLAPAALEAGDRLRLSYLEFEVCLPAEPDAPVVRPDAVERKGATPARRVLVVDDNEDAAESLAMLLRAWGHEVRVATDGELALEVARWQHPDTVFLDLRLSGLDGYEVARRLREQDALKGAALVAVTGYEREAGRKEARTAPFNRLLTKPVAPRDLQECLAPERR